MTRRRSTAWVLTALLVCSTLSTGCSFELLRLFGPNFTLGITIPLGLNGNPGILNPFGIVQALVNAALNQTTAGNQQVSALTPGQTSTGPNGTIVTILR